MSKKIWRVTTPKSAALLSNNLASNGKSVAYVAYSSFVVVPDNQV